MALTRATDKIIANADGNLNLSGIVTASSFVGSGSGLTGVASTDHIKTSTVANFSGGIQVGGATTLTGALTGTTGTFSSNVSITGNLGVGGTVTYEDVTNIDSVGVVTARSGLNVVGNDLNVGSNIKLGNASGIVTATTFSGSGASLTNLNGSNIASGTVPVARIGTGTKNTSTFYRGDGTFATVTSTTINNNADNRLITGSGTANTLEGEANLTFDGTNLDLGDSKKIRIGDSQDLELFHNGANSGIINSQGALYITNDATNSSDVHIRGKSSIKLHCPADGDVRIFIKSNGDIGFNDTSPTAHASGNNTVLSIKGKGSSYSGKIDFKDSSGNLDNYINSDNSILQFNCDPNSQNGSTSMQFNVHGGERLRITSDGKIGINDSTPSVTLETVGHNQVTFGSMPETIISYGTASAYNSGSAGSGIQFGGKYNSSGEYTIFAGVHGVKANTSDGPYGGALILSVRQNNTSSFERMRVSEYGTITNTTSSSHSQGAGTFNIKGVINQYSQGSGSGLIFDCDFGRLTGYSDDSNVNNGTNLSACLAHSTTDWSSSSSNTPMTVNGGTLQYRVGFGGYMEGISNGGRVLVTAGSGNPAMSDKLNTANMTIETWCWYDGDGREVIVSRYGSGFPNNFNMICDPNGQFHYNSGGAGAGSGNVSGEHFPDKTWHHHLWQYESGVHRWYINGAFANSRTGGSSVAVSSQTGFGIFSRADDYERFRGKIAVVRIYNRALSATEIKNHFELERGRFGV